MNPFSIAKSVISVGALIGVGKVINDVIANNTNVVTKADALKVATGSLLISGLVVDTATERMHGRVDQLQNWLEKKKEEKNSKTTENTPPPAEEA
jgi:hypothetical protein